MKKWIIILLLLFLVSCGKKGDTSSEWIGDYTLAYYYGGEVGKEAQDRAKDSEGWLEKNTLTINKEGLIEASVYFGDHKYEIVGKKNVDDHFSIDRDYYVGIDIENDNIPLFNSQKDIPMTKAYVCYNCDIHDLDEDKDVEEKTVLVLMYFKFDTSEEDNFWQIREYLMD